MSIYSCIFGGYYCMNFQAIQTLSYSCIDCFFFSLPRDFHNCISQQGPSKFHYSYSTFFVCCKVADFLQIRMSGRNPMWNETSFSHLSKVQFSKGYLLQHRWEKNKHLPEKLVFATKRISELNHTKHIFKQQDCVWEQIYIFLPYQ